MHFSIIYQTKWGEELFFVSGKSHIRMIWNPGGVWTADICVGNIENGTYHYEVLKSGKRLRREWKDHVLPDSAKGQVKDAWIDIPEDAPFRTSAFSDGVFAVDQDNKRPGRAENSDNRQGLATVKMNICGNKKLATIPEQVYPGDWKCAGTAVPVFALRTSDSFGIGDFHDLKKMADWAAATGQRVIQLLPVNDTTMTGTWTDSYPYSANSIYALHPQFLYLPEAGTRKDREYRELQAELEALQTVDYEKVNIEKDRLARKAFASTWDNVRQTSEFKKFCRDNAFWLKAWCAYRILRDRYGSADFSKWGRFARYSDRKAAKVLDENREEADYHTFVQYHLHRQLSTARDYARSKGVILKGDLPIGVGRNSVDAWQNPEQFHMDSCAGAPPDAFAADGQNWGFPTYNWDYMAKDGYSWWKARLKHMGQYFDAFRIDHILGFFRIWEIPSEAGSGLLGHFSPALPYSADELTGKGFNPDDSRYAGNGLNTLFIEDPHRKGFWHPRIAAQNTERYKSLPAWQKDAYNRLYDDFFYRRHNSFWRDSAMSKLPELLASTRMLACGEDLGMIPDCVPSVMHDLHILSLEIQRMPKDSKREFADTWQYPYMSVCATSTHDMTPLRAWWKEDGAVTRRFWNNILGQTGEAPAECTPEVSRSIIMMHLQSRSMMAILPLQDWLSLKPELCHENPEDERINIPSITPYSWRYRMKVTVDELMKDGITPYVKAMIRDCGRK